MHACKGMQLQCMRFPGCPDSSVPDCAAHPPGPSSTLPLSMLPQVVREAEEVVMLIQHVDFDLGERMEKSTNPPGNLWKASRRG